MSPATDWVYIYCSNYYQFIIEHSCSTPSSKKYQVVCLWITRLPPQHVFLYKEPITVRCTYYCSLHKELIQIRHTPFRVFQKEIQDTCQILQAIAGTGSIVSRIKSKPQNIKVSCKAPRAEPTIEENKDSREFRQNRLHSQSGVKER